MVMKLKCVPGSWTEGENPCKTKWDIFGAAVNECSHLLDINDGTKCDRLEVDLHEFEMLLAALGRGIGDPEDVKELLLAAAVSWGDRERQRYLRGMLDVIKRERALSEDAARHAHKRGDLATSLSFPLPTPCSSAAHPPTEG